MHVGSNIPISTFFFNTFNLPNPTLSTKINIIFLCTINFVSGIGLTQFSYDTHSARGSSLLQYKNFNGKVYKNVQQTDMIKLSPYVMVECLE